MSKLNRNEVYSVQIGQIIYNFKWLRNCNYSKKGIFVADTENIDLIEIIKKAAIQNNINVGYSLQLNKPTFIFDLSQIDMVRNGFEVKSFENAKKWLIASCEQVHKFKPVEKTIGIKLKIAISMMLNEDTYNKESEIYFTNKLKLVSENMLKIKLKEREEYIQGVINELPF